jgi:hypothetical protein
MASMNYYLNIPFYSVLLFYSSFQLMLYVSFKIKKKFRKASSASVPANSSEHRILFICFSQNTNFSRNKPKNLCYTQGTNVKEIKMKQALQKFEQLVTMLFNKTNWWLDDIFTC